MIKSTTKDMPLAYLRRIRNRYRFVAEAMTSELIRLDGPPLTKEQVSQVRPIFVLSTGRCGTNWLTQILSHSKQLYIRHEPTPRLWRQSVLAYSASLETREHFVELVRSARDDIMAASFRANKHYMETNNRLSFLAFAIAQAYPASRFIHLYRHPADFVRSAMRRNYYQDSKFDHSRITMSDGQLWNRMSPFEKACWLWNETNQLICNFLDELPPERRFSMSSENLWSESSSILQLVDFVAITDISQTKLEAAQKRPTNVQKRGQYSEYAKWTSENKSLLRRWCPLSSKLGYELD